MDYEDAQSYIYDHIPIVKKNGFVIDDSRTPFVSVFGSLADHVNHCNTAFGGSLSTALILASWATVRNILHANGYPEGVIVIQSQEVRFDQPVTDDFFARVTPVSDEKLRKFIAMLRKFGKSRIKIDASVSQRDDPSSRAAFAGDFVVMLKA